MSMYKTMYHPEQGARQFWIGDAEELKKWGWYDTPDRFPKTAPTPNLEAVEPEPKRRGRKPK